MSAVTDLESRENSGKVAALYTVLALGFACLYWLAVQWSHSGTLPFPIESAGFFRNSAGGTIVWAILSCFGPAIAAVIAVALFQGRPGLVRLKDRILLWRIPAWLYVAALFGAVINLAVIAAGYATGTMHYAPTLSFIRLPAMFLMMIVFDGPLGEEIGWRGVLLPELLERFKPLPASLMVGVVWYLWHIPLNAADGKGMHLAGHALFLYSCLALAVIQTWFFLRSGGSVFLAIFVHNCSNYFTFLRLKMFTRATTSPLPIVTYLVMLTLIAIAAGLAIRRARAHP